MCTAKTILLSKDKNNSAYPKVGDVRIIAVLPAITKLYELVLQEKINEALTINPLHPHQRGFVKGKSTQHNLQNILEILKGNKECLEE